VYDTIGRLTKIHKPNIPLGPIVNAIHSPTYNLSRFTAQTLQPLTGISESHLTNSMDFVQKIQKIRLRSTDLFVNFDVESLFTQDPIKDINIMKASYEVPSNLISLIKYCLTTIYFFCNNLFWIRSDDGSPISLVIINIFVEHFENIWKRPSEKYQKTRNLVPLCRRYIRDMKTRQSQTS